MKTTRVLNTIVCLALAVAGVRSSGAAETPKSPVERKLASA